MSVAEILRELGPSLSSSIVERLRALGTTPEAARKRISRSTGRSNVRRVQGIRFPHGEAFLYLDQDHDPKLVVERLWAELCKANAAPVDAVHSLRLRGGLALKRHFDILSGSPQLLKGHIASERILQFLVHYGLVHIRSIGELGECIELSEGLPFDVHPSPARLKARLLAERIVIRYLVDWVRQWGSLASTAPALGTATRNQSSASFSGMSRHRATSIRS